METRESPEGKEWYLKRTEKQVSPTGAGVQAFSTPSAQTALFLQNLSTLRGRMGEIRTQSLGAANSPAPAESGKNASPVLKRTRLPQGFYARTVAGQDRVPGFGGQNFRNHYWGAAVGYFCRANANWVLGAEFNAVEGKQRLQHPYHLSKGESESAGMIAAATWYDKHGAYCDFVIGADRYEQKLFASMSDGSSVHAEFTSLSPAVSVELGRKCSLGHKAEWFAEPQAQLTYYRAGGDDYVTSNGMHVSRPDIDSLTGRLGIALGKSNRNPDGKGLQWHIDAGVLHEFADDATMTVNGESFTAPSLGTRLYYGLGGDYVLSRRTQVYGYVGQETGADYKSDCKAQIGIRVTF